MTVRSKITLSVEVLEKMEYGFNVSVTFRSSESESYTGGSLMKAVDDNELTNSPRNFELFKDLVFNLNRIEKEGIKVVSGYKEYLDKCVALCEDPLSEAYFITFRLEAVVIPITC